MMVLLAIAVSYQQKSGTCPKCGAVHIVRLSSIERARYLRKAVQIALADVYTAKTDADKSAAEHRLEAAKTALAEMGLACNCHGRP